MFSSIMRAITPRGKQVPGEEESHPNNSGSTSNHPDSAKPQPSLRRASDNHESSMIPPKRPPQSVVSKTALSSSSFASPKQMLSQASVATPSTAATADITANNTTIDDSMEATISGLQAEEQQRKEANNNNTMETKTAKEHSNKQQQKPSSIGPSDLWEVLDTELRSNLGASVRCGICYSTVSDPVRTPCGHSFCRGCITSYLRMGSQSCPTCKAPCTRRSLETFSELDELADAYKSTLRAFGFAPGHYTPEITTMTQHVSVVGGGYNNSSSGSDEDDTPQARFDRLCVAATFQQALPKCAAKNIPGGRQVCSKLQIDENKLVVQANFEACFGETMEEENIEVMEKLLNKASSPSNTTSDSQQQQQQLDIPNTQDVQEQAREQLEANREMEESMEEMEEEQRQQHRQLEDIPNTQDVQEQAREQLEADREMEESMEEERQQIEQEASETKDNATENVEMHDKLKAQHVTTRKEAFEDDDDDDDFFVLPQRSSSKSTANGNTNSVANSSSSSNKVDLLDFPPPDFAKANDDNAKNRRSLARRSFSKRDSRDPSFGGGMSPIDHETSYFTNDVGDDNDEMPSPSNVTGMLEDSRGGLHMMPMTEDKRDESRESPSSNHSDSSDDKTIALTLEVESPVSVKDNNNNEGSNPSSDNNNSTAAIPMTQVDASVGEIAAITEQFHDSTKEEIFLAANLPAGPRAGPKRKPQLPPRTNLFAFQDDSSICHDDNMVLAQDDTMNSNDDSAPTEEDDRKLPAKTHESLSKVCKDTNSSSPEANDQDFESSEMPEWAIGTIVRVQARTWPGINKQGGVGRITKHNPDGTYNITYVLGGKESNVESIFISKEEDEEDVDDNGELDASGATETSPAIRKKRRRGRDKATSPALPEELLRQLAEEGFHVPGLKPKAKSKVNSKKPAHVLADTTNNKAKTSKKRKSLSSADTESTSNASNSKPKPRNRQTPAQEANSTATSTTTRRTKPIHRKENLPTTVKRGPVHTKKATRKSVSWSIDSPKESPTEHPSDDKSWRLAETIYQQKIEDAKHRQTVVVVASNISEADKALLNSLSGKTLTGNISLKYTETVDDTTTLCLVPSKKGKQNSVASVRTLKVMLSALRGIPLVTPDWLKSCYLQTSIVPPPRFIRTLPSKDKIIEASGEAICGVSRLAVACNHYQANEKITTVDNGVQSLPFDNVSVFLCGNYQGETKTNLIDLLKVGGAKILLQPKELDEATTLVPIVVVVGGAGGKSRGSIPTTPIRNHVKKLLENASDPPQSVFSKNVIVVDSQWVIESVTCAKLMPPDRFEPAILKDLWKLCL